MAYTIDVLSLGTLILAILAASYVTWRVLRVVANTERQTVTNSLRSRLRYQQARSHPYTIVENLTLGWLNLLLKFMWPGFVSNRVNDLLANLLRNLLVNVSTRSQKNNILKRIQVTIGSATDLKPTSQGDLPEQANSGELCMAYAELRAFGKIHATPVADQSSTPTWNWMIPLPMHGLPTDGDSPCVLHFTACNFISNNQSEVIGSAELALSSLGIEDLMRKEAFEVSVKLKSPKGKRGGGGVLIVKIQYDPNLQGTVLSGYPSVHAPGALATTSDLTSDSSSTKLYSPGSNGLVSMDMKDKAMGSGLEALKSEMEQNARDHDDLHKGEMVAYQTQVEQLQRALQAEINRRCQQELRSLVEGARFNIHRGWDTCVRHVWYSHSSQPPTVRWQSNNTMSLGIPGQGPKNKMSKRKQKYQEMAAASIVNIVYGDRLFPTPESNKGLASIRTALGKSDGQAQQKLAKSERCFTLVFSNRAALHLEIPSFGNGRSRNEWVSAWASLMYGNFDEPGGDDDDGEDRPDVPLLLP